MSSGSTLFTALCIGRSKGYYHSEITSGNNRSDVYSFGVVSNGVASYPGVQGRGGGGQGKEHLVHIVLHTRLITMISGENKIL